MTSARLGRVLRWQIFLARTLQAALVLGAWFALTICGDGGSHANRRMIRRTVRKLRLCAPSRASSRWSARGFAHRVASRLPKLRPDAA